MKSRLVEFSRVWIGQSSAADLAHNRDRRIDAQLLVIQICSRGGQVLQRSIPSKNIVSDCLLKRTQPSSSIPWSLQTKGKLHRTFLFSSLDLLSLDKFWTQKWRMGAGIGLKAKQKGRARHWWRRKEALAKWSIWNGD